MNLEEFVKQQTQIEAKIKYLEDRILKLEIYASFKMPVA